MNPTQNPIALRSKKVTTEVLLHLMTQYPYTEITVKHILLEAKISRKTFYRNFSSKDDVLNAYIDAVLNNYAGSLFEDENYSFVKMLDTIFCFCDKYQSFLFVLRDNELLYLLLRRLNDLILAEHFKVNRYNSVNNNNFNIHALSAYIVSFNIGGVWNIIVRWLENNMSDSVDDIKKAIVYYLSNIKAIDLRDI